MTATPTDFVSNFAFMERYVPVVAELGARAEAYFTSDPNTSLFKLRQLVEELAKQVAARCRVPRDPDHDLYTLLCDLQRRRLLPETAARLCHEIRRAGNSAVHELAEQHKEALTQLRNARNLCVWYVGEFGDRDLKLPKFRTPPPPPDPAEALARAYAEQQALADRLAALEAEGRAARAELEARARKLSQPRVLFSQAFLALVDALPDAVRSRILAELAQYRDDPEAAALSSFDGIADGKLRWLALGDDHCAVVAVSPHHDVHLVVWLGAFEEALAWVRGRRVEVNAVLGSIQVFHEPEAVPAPARHGLFAALSDAELLRCGVPPVLVPAVRAVTTTDELVALGQHLPQEPADVLAAVADGMPLDQALAEAGLRAPKQPVDTADFDVAAAHQATRRSFAELDDRTFEEMLRAPIEQWRVFLHPSQAQVVRRRFNGPVRVLGGAGTGKTVALLHRVVHLVRDQLPDPTDRILVTTFTRTLTFELRRNLALLLSPDEMQRITVDTLNRVASQVARGAGHKLQVAQRKTLDACWDAAIAQEDPSGAFPKAFYTDEWDLVVQSRGLLDRQGYFAASRQGRGTALSRRDRAAIWRVFEAYRAQLAARKVVEFVDVVHLAREVLEASATKPYRAVLVDEVQDFGAPELRLVRALAPEAPGDLFLVGDAHQRIYKLGTTLGACGIHIRGRSVRLKVNYRTTQRIQAFAFGVLAGETFDDLDGGEDHLLGYRSLRLGTPPTVRTFATPDEEQAAIVAQVRGWIAQGVAPASICVAARTGWLRERYGAALRDGGLRTVDLDDDEGEALPADAVRISTLHRLKGTEFSRVVLAAVQEGVVPMRPASSRKADEAAVDDFLHQERCLMYVAATRARDELVITGAGRPSPLTGGGSRG